jgi:hypothetical protein
LNLPEIPDVFIRVDSHVSWFTELDREDKIFPTFYNILSKDITTDIGYISDELYFATMLEKLNCSFFVPYLGKPKDIFKIQIIKKIIDIQENIKRLEKDLYLINPDNSFKTNEKGERIERKPDISTMMAKNSIQTYRDLYENTLKPVYQQDIKNSINNGFLENQKMIIEQFQLIH